METKNKTAVQDEVSQTAQLQNTTQPRSLEEVKEYFRQKEQKIKLLDSIEANISKLESVKDQNIDQDESSNYFTDSTAGFVLVLSQQNEYNRTEKLFSVTNPWLIDEVLSLVLQKMEFKADTLRAEIMA